MSLAPRRPRDPILLSFVLLLLLAGSVSRDSVNQDTAPLVVAPASLGVESPPAAVAVVAPPDAVEAPKPAPSPLDPRPSVAPQPIRDVLAKARHAGASSGSTPTPSPRDPPSASRPPTRDALAKARDPEVSGGNTLPPSASPDIAAGVSGTLPHARVENGPALPLLQDEFAHNPPAAFGEASLSPAILSVVVSGAHSEAASLRGSNIVTDHAFAAATGVASLTQNQAINGATVQNISIFATSR